MITRRYSTLMFIGSLLVVMTINAEGQRPQAGAHRPVSGLELKLLEAQIENQRAQALYYRKEAKTAQGIDWAKLTELFLQVVTILTGISVIVWQVGRQHRSSLELQREHQKDEQRLKLFDDLTEKISTAESALVNVSLWGLFVPSALRMFIEQSRPDFRPAPVRYRAVQLLELRRDASRAVQGVVSSIEYREVINPAFVIFRYAISHQLERADSAFQEFHSGVLPLLPVDPPQELAASGKEARILKTATNEDIAAIKELGKKLQAEYLKLTDYLNDLSREVQNELLGRLFDHQVQPRKPLDSDVLVIGTSSDQIEKAEQRLELAKHLHPDVLPSKALFPQDAAAQTSWKRLWRKSRG